MSTLLHDLRYGLRALGKNPGFTAVAVLSLALGIGANTAIFSLLDALLLRDLPVRQPERLVELSVVPEATKSCSRFRCFERSNEGKGPFPA